MSSENCILYILTKCLLTYGLKRPEGYREAVNLKVFQLSISNSLFLLKIR